MLHVVFPMFSLHRELPDYELGRRTSAFSGGFYHMGWEKLDATSANPSSSTCAVSFTKTNPHTSGPSVGGISMSNPFAQLVNHFDSRTTIAGSAPTFGMPQRTMASMFEQGYIHTAPSFTISNPGLAPYTPCYNGRAYPNPNSSYQAPYTIVAYTDPIPLPDSSLGFLPNHAY
jgi:hypothetical protein